VRKIAHRDRPAQIAPLKVPQQNAPLTDSEKATTPLGADAAWSNGTKYTSGCLAYVSLQCAAAINKK
jgi:hypothetical protein